MSETVTVKLNRRRPYRARPSDRGAVWVGPGLAEVPGWVAREWGLTPQASVTPPVTPAGESVAPSLPLADYDTLSAAQIIQAAPGLSATQRKILAAYERRHKARKTVLDALET